MNTRAQPIIITGFMGAGKTTVAGVLSRKLGCAMIDLDYFITERMGRTPQTIIDEDGEQRFRELESQALSDALETCNVQTIALGGGTWTIESNRALIKERNGFTIWLDAPFKLCWQRISSESRSRPLARDFDSARELYDKRRAVYDQAMLRVEVCEERSADAIALEIIDALSLWQES
ncbi:MAG TPA: shikimate kinase [Pyrinomonadaceae bacterium]|jgi:shikimate kinase|nr:shikimate kinase [Pyrinomonadaceae bacterium]